MVAGDTDQKAKRPTRRVNKPKASLKKGGFSMFEVATRLLSMMCRVTWVPHIVFECVSCSVGEPS